MRFSGGTNATVSRGCETPIAGERRLGRAESWREGRNVMAKISMGGRYFVKGKVLRIENRKIENRKSQNSWRREIFEASEKAEPSSRMWYFVNRFLAGLGSFLLVFAISETHPAIVQAITGVRYVIIFIGAFGLARLRPDLLAKNFTRRVLLGKSVATLMIMAGLVLVGLKGGKVASTERRDESKPRLVLQWLRREERGRLTAQS